MKNITLTALLFLNLFVVPKALAQTNFEYFFGGSQTDYSSVYVEKVITADSITLRGGEKVVLIGLKALAAPRIKKDVERDEFGFVVKQDVSPDSPIEEQAFFYVQDLLEGQNVRLEFDRDKKNDDLKTLAYVFLEDGTFVNAEILRLGFADLSLSPLNKKYEQQLRDAYQEARDQFRGIQSR